MNENSFPSYAFEDLNDCLDSIQATTNNIIVGLYDSKESICYPIQLIKHNPDFSFNLESSFIIFKMGPPNNLSFPPINAKLAIEAKFMFDMLGIILFYFNSILF